MLSTRLWMGALLILLATGVLLLDQEPLYPFLLLLSTLLALLACFELHQLLGSAPQSIYVWVLAVLGVLLANWAGRLTGGDPWHFVLGAFTALVLVAFLVEMATFREPGRSVTRIALTVWATAYLGLLPSFLVQLRWWKGPAEASGAGQAGVAALALAIFVPKFCDIGAYFTGRLLGRTPMSPALSPKKTWEGLAGGLTLSALTAVVINRPTQVLRGGDLAAIGFGLAVGLAGVLGDLAESLIKRDCRQKDASQIVPGFGGVLDVIDAVLFAAPVAYVWLCA
jgi:phosphatidate cytidylyltransferase